MLDSYSQEKNYTHKIKITLVNVISIIKHYRKIQT